MVSQLTFYKVFWEHLSEHFLNMFEEIWQGASLGIEARKGIISLLPKQDRNLLHIKNWRPITLLTVEHKLMAKVYATRLQKVIPYLVSEEQFGFVQNKQIQDVIRYILEIIQHCDNEQLPSVLVSLDIEKCFDSIDREALDTILTLFGFGNNFLIMINTLSKLELTTTNNGFTSGNWIEMESGLIQGSPLSPYLALLVLEGLMFANLSKQKNQRHQNSGNPEALQRLSIRRRCNAVFGF